MTVSLWLVPHDNPFTRTVQELISDTIPPNFSHKVKKHKFTPHVTLTSDIDPQKAYGGQEADAQAWLDGINLPPFKKESNEVVVEMDHVEAGEPFFKKLTVALIQDKNLLSMAASCRQAGVKSSDATADAEKVASDWAKNEYAPHMSLMYADLPKSDVQAKVGLVELQIGWALGSLFDCCGGTLCMGGNLVLVDTSKPIEEWKPFAQRDTPYVMWRMNRNLC